MRLTFLRGASPDYSPAKRFAIKNNQIEKISGYDAGYMFFHKSIEVPEDLQAVAQTLQDHAKQGYFRIHGIPTDELTSNPSQAVRRLSENFPAMDSRLAMFDIDDLEVPPELTAKHKWQLHEPDTTAALIRDLLTAEGLTTLAMADMVFLLTSSQFTRDKLRCHVYFLFEQPKSLEELRAISIGLNHAKAQKIFDPAPYNPVQPDYIAPPDCTNFQDPIPPNGRIAYSPGVTKYIPEEAFRAELALLVPQGWMTSGLVSKLADNWLATIKLYVGTEKGINEPAFRAAAQLVHEVGRSEVIANIDSYAKKLHDAAWDAILANGGRGGPEDRQTYDVARFRQYLESATRPGKGFGTVADEALRMITEAINLCAQGNYGAIVDRTVVDAAIKLREKHPAAWLIAKALVKNKLKGVLSVPEFDKLCKRQAITTRLAPLAGGLTETPTGELVPFGPVDNENNLIWPVLATYKFIRNQDDNEFFMPPSEKETAYPLSSEVVNFFYRDGLIRSNNNVTMHFGKKCLSVLMADKNNPVNNGIPFTRRLVGSRIVPIGPSITDGMWYNAGKQPDGVARCLRITPDGVTVFDSKDADVCWTAAYPNIVPTDEMTEERWGDKELATPEFLIKFYLERITKYIACNEEDVLDLTSWLVTAMTNRPLAYIGEFIGPYNCGKSTGADLAKDLIDPSFHTLGAGGSRSTFSGVIDENFFSLLHGQQVTIIDNVGVLKPQVQDVLCQVSTGMKFNRRVLYTMSQQEMFIQKPLIFTGLARMITRPDLVSRTLTINFNRTPMFNPNFLEEWKRDKPFFFGALLHICSETMRRIRDVSKVDARRVSQREIVIGAVSAILKLQQGVDVKHLETTSHSRYLEQLDGSNFCRVFILYLNSLSHDTLSGTSNELLEGFKGWVQANVSKRKQYVLRDANGTVILDKQVDVLMKEIPDTPVAFGWSLGKYTAAINTFSGWEIQPVKRSGKGNIRTIQRKKMLTDIF